MLSSCCVADSSLESARDPEYGPAPRGWPVSPEALLAVSRGSALKKRTLPFETAVNAAAGAAHGVFFNLTNATRVSLEVEEMELCSWSGAPCELTLYSVSSGDPCIGTEDYEEEWSWVGAVSVFEDLDAVCLRLRAPVSIRPRSSRGFYLHTPGTSTEVRDGTGACGVGNPLRLILPGPRQQGSVGLSAVGAADSALKVEPWLLSLSPTPFTHITQSAKRTPAGKITYHTEASRADLLNSEPPGPGQQRVNPPSNFLPCCAAAFRGGDEQETAWTAAPVAGRAFQAV